VSGWDAYDTGDLETAAAIAEQVMGLFPEDGEAYALLGAVLAAQRELISAIEHFETSREMGFDNAIVNSLLLNTYAERASQIIDEIYSTWNYEEIQSLIYEAQDLLETARTSGLGRSDRIIALDEWFTQEWDLPSYIPEQVSPAYEHWSAAATYEEAGDFSAAVEEIEIAVTLDLETPELHAHAGDLNFQLGEYQTAIEHYLNALELNPDLIYARTSLGYAYLYNALPLHAREAFVTAMLAIPDREGIQNGLDGLEITFGTWDDTLLLDYGFRFTVPGDGEFFELQEDLTSPETGSIGYIDGSTMLSLIWMPYEEWRGTGVPISQAVRQTPPMAMFGEITYIGNPIVFAYSPVEITYQPYLLTPDGNEDEVTLAIYALWQCDQTVFILSQLVSNSDPENLFIFNPYLESVTCDLDSIVPEHP
jgi:tetratricopeptide (TPR) repeat protein